LKSRIALHLSLTPLDYDARINRTLAALNANGYRAEPLAVGEGLAPVPMDFRQKSKMAMLYPWLSLAGNWGAQRAFWAFPHHRIALAKVIARAPSLIHAHDWDALPIAARASEILNIPFVYDSHEYARQMHAERMLWRTTMSRAITNLETAYIPHAAAVIAVSQGIADLLTPDCAHGVTPLVLRNIPEYVEPSLSPRINNDIIMHYHGILATGRGIETYVEALKLLPQTHRLILVGPERQKGFIGQIKSKAETWGVASRIEFIPSVPPQELVALAAQADFGLCLLTKQSLHNQHALPNKVFEYIMAGLFCIVSDGPEMAALVTDNEAGAVLKHNSAQELAALMLSTPRANIEDVRKRNFQTARTLNWQQEQKKLLGLYAHLLHG
jgi:glycogen synthase